MNEELDIKLVFEKELSELLKKYVVKSDAVLIQKAEIIVEVGRSPLIKLEAILF